MPPESIRALFAFPGFTASSKLLGVFADRYARVIQLKRRKNSPLSALSTSLPGGVRSATGSKHREGTSLWCLATVFSDPIQCGHIVFLPSLLLNSNQLLAFKGI